MRARPDTPVASMIQRDILALRRSRTGIAAINSSEAIPGQDITSTPGGKSNITSPGYAAGSLFKHTTKYCCVDPTAGTGNLGQRDRPDLRRYYRGWAPRSRFNFSGSSAGFMGQPAMRWYRAAACIAVHRSQRCLACKHASGGASCASLPL